MRRKLRSAFATREDEGQHYAIIVDDGTNESDGAQRVLS
jgi:hypothetical protein